MPGKRKLFKSSPHTPIKKRKKKNPHLTNSFSSRCLVNYSLLLNNWGARKYESFNDAAACIRTHVFILTQAGEETVLEEHGFHTRFKTVLVFINELPFFMRHISFPLSAEKEVEERFGVAVLYEAFFHSWYVKTGTQWINRSFYAVSFNMFVLKGGRGCSECLVMWQSSPLEALKR